MMLQRLATGAIGVKQARYRRRPTRRGTRTRMRSIYDANVMYVHVRPAYEFRRGFCTLVLFLPLCFGRIQVPCICPLWRQDLVMTGASHLCWASLRTALTLDQRNGRNNRQCHIHTPHGAFGVCVCVCVCVCARAHVHACVHVCMSTYVCVYRYIHKCVCVHCACVQ